MRIILNAIAILLTVHWSHGSIVGVTNLANVSDSVLSCAYNNTRFANGSFVPTPEPCLNCKCVNANLICALRVCPEQLMPPPRGCVIVQKRESCCPYLTCTKLHKDDNKQVVTHDRKWYEQNIKNRIFSQNALQRRIEDSDEDQTVRGNQKMCIHNGTVYRSGSAMTTSSLCSYCYCIEGKQKCIKPKCILPAKGCEPILIDSACCPVRYDCTGNGTIKARYNTKYNRRRNDNKHYLRMTSRMQRSRGCLVDSTFYPEGHKLPKNQTNPCEICFCIGGSKRCTPKKCAPMIKNCKPIIPDGQCCPSSYDCDNKPKIPTAREFQPRQYDFFSLLFGDEENSTKHWDDGVESETVSAEHVENSTNEKSILDAIKDGLKYIDSNASKLENASTEATTFQSTTSANIEAVDDDDDEEEISIFDFFLNGEKAFTPTTPKIDANPLHNGITNSPMHIQPVLPDNMKNESIKFAMLPMSLYNMVKDDGTIMMFDSVSTEVPKITPPIKVQTSVQTKTASMDLTATAPDSKKSNRTDPFTVSSTPKTVTLQAFVSPVSDPIKSGENSKHELNGKLTNLQQTANKVNAPIELKSETPTALSEKSTETLHLNSSKLNGNKSSISTTKSKINNTEQSTKTVVETTTAATIRTKPASTVAATKNVPVKSNSVSTTTTPSKSTKTTMPKTSAVITVKPPIVNVSSPVSPIQKVTKPAVKYRTPLPTATSTKPIHTTPANILKYEPIPIRTNPILETDINYDYGEPTLPPSLPNLKIIPFLPTDAVKNIVKSDNYKSNYNYYQSNPSAYTNTESQHNYSPFNSKPSDKYPVYHGNIADDRIDYGYKETQEKENIDYVNIYAGNNGVLSPGSASGQAVVSSKVDYATHLNENVYGNPSRLPPSTTTNKNLIVKPPLPPFEPEHEYDLYHLQSPTKLQQNGYDEYSVNVHVNVNSNNANANVYSGEHNYHVPQLVTARPIKPPYATIETIPIESVFSYKNQFSPPLETEGGFIPKRPANDNYIPLRGTNYYVEHPTNADGKTKTDNSTNLDPSGLTQFEETLPEFKEIKQANDANQTNFDFEKHIISITTDASYKSTEEYSDAFVGFDVINSLERQSENQQSPNKNGTTSGAHELNIAPIQASSIAYTEPQSNETIKGESLLNNIYGFLFKDEEIVSSSSSSQATITSSTTVPSSTEMIKVHKTNKTNNSNQSSVPLKLITIINNSKKENPTKAEIKQRKNNKIIDPTDEPLLDDSALTTEATTKNDFDKAENLTFLRDVLLASLGRPHGEISDELLHKSPLFLQRPINKLSPSFISSASFPSLTASNAVESKQNFQKNAIRSELDLIIPELNKNKQSNDFSHMNNYSPENYQVLPTDDTHISNTESYVINPVDVDKLKEHHTQSETQIFTPPHKDPAGLLKLAGCNIYGRMYRVGRIIAELSSPCLECRCTEVGVSCTPLNC